MARRVTALVLVCTLCGCSLFMRGVPEDHQPPADPECQPYLLVPIVDGIVGAAGLALSIGGPCFDEVGNCSLGLAASLGFLATAAYGYLKVRKCERAIEQYKSGSAPEQSDEASDDD